MDPKNLNFETQVKSHSKQQKITIKKMFTFGWRRVRQLQNLLPWDTKMGIEWALNGHFKIYTHFP